MLLFVLQAAGGGFPYQFLLIGGMLAVMYFFMIRPQTQREKKGKEFINALAVGQQVVTSGGIHGKITRIDADSFMVQIDKMTTVRVERDAIAVEKTQALATNAAKTDNTPA